MMPLAYIANPAIVMKKFFNPIQKVPCQYEKSNTYNNIKINTPKKPTIRA